MEQHHWETSYKKYCSTRKVLVYFVGNDTIRLAVEQVSGFLQWQVDGGRALVLCVRGVAKVCESLFFSYFSNI